MKKHTHYLSFCALFLCTILLGSRIFSLWALPTLEVGGTAPLDSVTTIILDAGHGGEDGGATGVNGVLEKNLNLSLTKTLAALLRSAGYHVVETRTEDTLLYSPDAKKGHKKQSDLENRLALTKEYPNSVLISIHMNTFPNDTCRGTQVWYSESDPDSFALATAVQARVRDLLQPQNNRKIKAATSSIYLLRHATTPAILVECGFLSTPDECEALCEDTYQKQLALSIFSAICEKIPCESANGVL